MDYYYDLGAYSRTISTSSDAAQVWFNRCLKWCYAFNHEEAVRCFDQVVALDPNCAMGYWGKAYAVGPYYNIPWAKMSPNGLVRALVYTPSTLSGRWSWRNPVRLQRSKQPCVAR